MKNIKKIIVLVCLLIQEIYSNVKIFKRNEKKRYLTIKKSVNEELKNKISQIDYESSNNIVQACFRYLFDTDIKIIYSENKTIIYDKLIKDSDFMNFFTKLVIVEKVFILSTSKRKLYEHFFGDIRAILMSYTLYKEKNVDINKVLNFLSFFLKGSKINDLNENISEYKLKQIEMITTGIKFKKLVLSVNNIDYNPTTTKKKEFNCFNIIKSMNNRIRIKYDSGKNHKHTNGHSSPKTHNRREYYKTLRNGKSKLINATIVNANKAS
ncbi:hypothetical protein NG782_02190 [Aliarcobacter cryaerophilus]|uniref:hypothetical protein n=1 Tax=Aliarcobacter cryaerophilus TaxID=28198 RepID=UPI003DA3B460